MAYRGGGRGGRGDQRGPPYGHGRGTGGGGGGRSRSSVWPPTASTPRPVPALYQAEPMGFRAPMATHQAASGGSPPAAPPAPQIVFAPPPAPVPVTIRAPTPAPLPAPATATHQPATAPAPASSAPSAAALVKEIEKKLFVSETALAPASAAAAVAVVATHEGTAAAAEDAPDVELAPVSKKGLAYPARPGVGTVGKKVMIRANHFLVDVADNNLFHYDVVASMDLPEITKYRGLVSAQPHRQEIIEDIFTISKDPQKGRTVNGGMIRELLIAFGRKTNRRPERIIFYRDGVSEGQFSHVLLHEMVAIRKACASLEEGYLPPFTFVVVQKRHHTRLFPEFHGRRDMTDRSGNILPGTVVDQKICHPTEFDFYLCSHAGIQGTSQPTHYHVLYDENHFTTDALQSLTNNLCYTYARCTHPVSLVAPAYYAHLAAFRARYYVEGDSSDGGSTPGSCGQAVVREWPIKKLIRGTTPTRYETTVKDEDNTTGVEVWIFDRSVTLKISRNSYLEIAVCKALAELKFCLSDFYVTNPQSVQAILSMDSVIGSMSKMVVNPRLRGGVDVGPSTSQTSVSLDKLIGEMKKSSERWLEVIQIPSALRRGDQVEDHIVDQGPDAAFVLRMALDLFERANANNECYDGRFSMEDIYFLPLYGVLVMDDKVIRRKLTFDGYKADLDNVVNKLLAVHYKYKKSIGTYHYPLYVRDLVGQIKILQKKDMYCFSMSRRSLIFNHPATWSAARRVNTPSLVVRYINGLRKVDRDAVEVAMRSWGGIADWRLQVSDKKAPPAMMDVYYHQFWDGTTYRFKSYPETLLGIMDCSKCIIYHAMDCQVSVHVVDAALSLLWPAQLRQIQTLLTVNYKPPSKKVKLNKGKGVATWSLTHIYRLDEIPIKEDLEIFEIFGLPREPKN